MQNLNYSILHPPYIKNKEFLIPHSSFLIFKLCLTHEINSKEYSGR